MTLINWLLNLKMYANAFFLIFIWKYDMIFIYIFERLGHMHTYKTYFLFFISENF